MLTTLRFWVRMATRYLWGRKLRTILTVVAIALAVMLIFGLNGVLPAMLGALQNNLISATGQVDVTISSVSNDTFGSDVVNRIQTVPGVAVVSPSLQRVALLGDTAPASSVQVTGVDPTSYNEVRAIRMGSGRFLATGDGNVMVIPSTLAQRAGLKVGDNFEVPGATGSTTYRIVGIADVPGAPGVEAVYVPLGAAQQLFLQGGKVNVVDVKVQPGADRKAVADAIQRKLGSAFQIGGLGSSDQLLSSLSVSENAINLFGLFALAMGGFIILNTFRTVVTERRRDIGMLRAMGASRATILGTLLAEATFEGAAGTALGLLLGYGLAWAGIAGLNPIAKQFLQFTIPGPVFLPTTWVVAITVGMGMTLIGGAWPAVQAARLSPMEVLRPQPPEVTRAKIGWTALAGAVIVVASIAMLLSRNVALASSGVLLFLVGLVMVSPVLVAPAAAMLQWAARLVFRGEGFIAARNSERQPSRAAVTISVMMIGLSIVVGIIGMIASVNNGFLGYLQNSLGADYLVFPKSILLAGGNVGSGPGLLASIKSAPGIADATSLREAKSKIGNTTMQVVGVDPTLYPKVGGLTFTQGDQTQAWDALGAGRAAIVNGIFAAQNPTQLGDYITLQTAQGEKRYRVVGVGTDYLNAKLATAYISQDNLRKDFNETSDLLIMANRKPGADPAHTKLELRKIVSQYPAFTLYDFAEWRTSQLETLNATISLYYVMALVIALPSLLALVNTLAMSVLERTREIGMMRAVGSTRTQIGRIVLAESLMLASMGTVLGVIAGIWMAYALVGALSSSGFPLTFFFPWEGIVAGIIAGIVFGVLAAMLPARSAARLNIVESLAYE
jgi:putative ABC transport system permease protein